MVIADEEVIVCRSPLMRAMFEELRKKLEPLERSGIPLNHLSITIKRTGHQVTSEAFIGGGGFTPIPNSEL